jgi:CubicO group peptidase (beta-lactamase class C family)
MRLVADDALAGTLSRLAAEQELPGAAAGVIVGDEYRVANHGVTSVTDPLPVDVDTAFLIGSTTKTVTATALTSLVEAGHVGFDDPVRKHLPDLRLADPTAAEAVTVRMLVNHTAGWRGDGVADTGWGDDALARALEEFLPGEPQLFAPGAHTSYNNSAVLLAGRLLEVLDGKTWDASVRARVLDPLGMASSFTLPWEVANRRLAVGHLVAADRAEPVLGWPLTRAAGPAGGLVSTLRDQLRYARFHLDGTADGTLPLSDDSRLLMQSLSAPMRSGASGVGLSWLLQDRGDLSLVTHGGNISNLHCSAFALVPTERFAVVLLTNSRGGMEAGRQLLDWACDHYLQRPVPEPLPATRLAPDLAADYVGRFDAGTWEQEVTVVQGELHTRMCLPQHLPAEVRALFDAPPVPLVLVGDDLVARADRPWEPAGDFVRDSDGRVVWFRWGMRLARRVPSP